MRDYGRVSPRFWTGGTGKSLRGDPEAQLVALYLMTCPSASMTGLFYLPLPTIAHETGIPIEGAREALRRLSEGASARTGAVQEAPSKPLRSPFEGGFCHYDESEELVFVPSMARWQIGEAMDARDKRVVGIMRELSQFKSHRFYTAFLEIYGECFCLPEQAPSKPLRSPFEAKSRNKSKNKNRRESAASDPADHSPPSDSPPDEPGEPVAAEPAPVDPDVARMADLLRTDPQLAPIVADPVALAAVLVDREAFPGIDPLGEVKRAAAWLLANPKQRKSQGARFLTNWLTRSQERCRAAPDGVVVRPTLALVPDDPPPSGFAERARRAREAAALERRS